MITTKLVSGLETKFIFSSGFTFTNSKSAKAPSSINRMRKIIYENISTVRHQMNVTQRIEP